MTNDEWILDRSLWETDEEYLAAAEFWRRELGRLVDGVPISDHLTAGRDVVIDLHSSHPQ